MKDVFDIYDSTTFRLVKKDVTLTKKGTHKDLKPGRYIKLRIGREPEPYDFDLLIKKVADLERKLANLESNS